MGSYPETNNRVGKLLKKRKSKCTYCGQYFTTEDIMEVDHIIPKSQGEKNTMNNLQLLHRHCHDVKTRLANIDFKEVQDFNKVTENLDEDRCEGLNDI